MSLRTRLFLTSLLIAVPLAVAWFLLDTHMRLPAKELELRRSVELDLASGLQERCEADPPQVGRPGRGGGGLPRGPGAGPNPRGRRPPAGSPGPPGAEPEGREPPPPAGPPRPPGAESEDREPPPPAGPPRPPGAEPDVRGAPPPAGPPRPPGAEPDVRGAPPPAPPSRPSDDETGAPGDPPQEGPGGSRPRGPGGGPKGPARGGGTSGAYEYYAYNASGTPSAADAPPLPAERDGATASTYWAGAGRGVALVVPLGGDGPCAYLLARIPPRPGEIRDQAQALALVVVSVLVAAWFAAGPVIAKLRRLAEGVHQSAASHYAEPVAVEGRDEVADLAGAFNEAGRRIRAHLVDVQSREAALRGFVADTTHDVAIPLTVLQGHLAELDRELAAPAHREHVRAAVQEAHYMASLLRNLATATTLDESGTSIVHSPVDLSSLVERVVERHRPIARASGVELNLAVPDPALVIPSDPTLLEQALSNLVDNAIRYNHAGGHVAVLLDREGTGFLLSVTDDGPGVKAEELAQLTTRWFRGSAARTRRPDGHGLGLAIAAESLKRLGLALTFHRPAEGGLRAEIRRQKPI